MKTNVSVHSIFAATHLILALVTLIPLESVSKASMLGYKALCSFTPISTVILVGMAGLHIFLHNRAAKVAG
ncbi:MAG: hypothetical protein DWQ07_11070 [Chloroflexi bacterium]|nr:MAG: hypothetical protein DWQ07_11070 [Chloroflexota bacterium]MBL1192744.1 hypothetical protein [Chloroflexota bacterium]NOH10037.1 hypothetical protein [Chloroflexota bacterium]